MARIRTIKPEFFDDETICELPFAHRLCYVGLWTQADKDGRMEDRPLRLKARLFPYDDVDMDGMLTDLARAGFIIRYLVGGKAYIAIKESSWRAHQMVRSDEPSRNYPAPNEHAVVYASLPMADHSDPRCSEARHSVEISPARSRADDALEQHGASEPDKGDVGDRDETSLNYSSRAAVETLGKERKGREGKGEYITALTRGDGGGLRDRFEVFWQNYPRKVGKDAAWREWQKLKPGDDLLDQMLSAVTQQRASAQWLRDGGQFIPHPRTWLHHGRWQDEPHIEAPHLSRRTLALAQSDQEFLSS